MLVSRPCRRSPTVFDEYRKLVRRVLIAADAGKRLIDVAVA